MSDRDWENKRVKEFIGRRVADPSGTIIGGYIDGVGIMLLDVQLDDDSVEDNIPRTNVEFV